MRALEAEYKTLQKLNTVALGFSVDSVPCKKAWGDVLEINNISLPCDFWPHGKVAQDYGVFNEKYGISERANVIIDESGKIVWVKVYPMEQLPDISEILDVLSGK